MKEDFDQVTRSISEIDEKSINSKDEIQIKNDLNNKIEKLIKYCKNEAKFLNVNRTLTENEIIKENREKQIQLIEINVEKLKKVINYEIIIKFLNENIKQLLINCENEIGTILFEQTFKQIQN
eukprot:TRINITY_DN5369_c0_g1_i2.p1 TRINITY_DN5369_c0_g1~~TRINITY_DN5369_c0_g1_i2.p1  ORF type:complete len:123 (+),score=42.30 TRINITY_DN5369_c0_g1_i2:314-682(+)